MTQFQIIITHLFFVWASQASAQTVSFRAYDFATPQLSNRSDIKKLSSQTTLTLPAKVLTSLSKLNLPPVQHKIDTEIINFLEGFAGQSLPRASQESWCAELKTAIQAGPSSVQQSCQTLQKNYLADRSTLEKFCNNIENPENFVTTQAAGVVIEEDLRSVEGMIKTVGEPISRIPSQIHLSQSDFYLQLKNIIRKIRYPTLSSDLRWVEAKVADSAQSLLAHNCFLSSVEKDAFETQSKAINAAVKNLSKRLFDMNSLGQAQALADQQAIERQGRKRNSLPYPSLNDKDRKFLTWVLGGIFWRMRGGGLLDYPSGTNETRRLYTEVIFRTLTVFNCGQNCDGLAKSVGSSQRFALIMRGWGKYMDIGHTPNQEDRFHDLVQMSARGIYQVSSTATTLEKSRFDVSRYRLAGSQMGACYDFGWEKMNGIGFGEKLALPYSAFLFYPTEWAEFCIGAIMSKGLAESLLNGQSP